MNTDAHLRIIIWTLVTLIIVGTVLFRILEPFTWIQAFYFTVSTMTTVGYGDLVPSTDITRLVVAFYALISVTLYISLATFLGIRYLERQHARGISRKGRDADTEQDSEGDRD